LALDVNGCEQYLTFADNEQRSVRAPKLRLFFFVSFLEDLLLIEYIFEKSLELVICCNLGHAQRVFGQIAHEKQGTTLLGSTNSVSIYNTMSSDFHLVMLGLTKWKNNQSSGGLREFGYSLSYMMQKK
jgi:hypothetical protein